MYKCVLSMGTCFLLQYVLSTHCNFYFYSKYMLGVVDCTYYHEFPRFHYNDHIISHFASQRSSYDHSPQATEKYDCYKCFDLYLLIICIYI